MSGDLDLDECEALAEEVARKAGAVIREALVSENNKASAKTSYADLVTDTDKECERIIITAIKARFPKHRFIGEEEVSQSGVMPELTDEPTWMIDPVDGTTNFVHAFPFVCVCVGLCVRKRPVLGIVYNPVLEEFFKAKEGCGAWLNGRRIHCSDTSSIKAALFATEVGTKRDQETIDATYNRVSALTSVSRSVRMTGSCACNMTSVACGRLDGFYEFGFGGPWDVAAAACILEEAGGKVIDPQGGPFDVMSHRVLATNAHLHKPMSDVLKSVPLGPSDPPAPPGA